jgi:FHS family L-fucose permease-like MFS transporter
MLLVLVSLMTHGAVSGGSLLAVGLCNSVMVPILFTTTIAGLEPNTSRASGLMVGAMIGGAVIPVCQGALADRVGLHQSFWVPVGCYGVVMGFGVMTGWGRFRSGSSVG